MTTDSQHATDLAATWCRMWNDDPSLSADLVGDRVDMWFATSANDGRVTDAASLEAFVVAYREQTPNHFTPRTVVADPVGHRMAYTWDVEVPTGVTTSGIRAERLSGIDVNVLDDRGRVVANWTAPMPTVVAHDLPTPPWPASSRATLTAKTVDWLSTLDARPDGEVVVDVARQRTAICLVTTVDGAEVGGLAVLAFAAPGGSPRAWTAIGSQPPMRYS